MTKYCMKSVQKHFLEQNFHHLYKILIITEMAKETTNELTMSCQNVTIFYCQELAS